MLQMASTSAPDTRVSALAHRVRLRDGRVLEVRPILPEDGDRLRRFHARLSPATVVLRYFHVMTCLPDALVASFTHVDYQDHMALVATFQGSAPPPAAASEEIVSLANYDRHSADTAEVAFVVEDAWQGQGIARILLYDLAAHARTCGFSRLLAILLYRNSTMLALLRQCGFPCLLHDRGDDEMYAWLDISAPPRCRFTPHAR